MSQTKQCKVAIIGGGVMGITTALRLKECMPNCEMTIFAEEFSPKTTSDFSTGYWEPFCFSESDCTVEQMLKWAKDTYDRFLALAISPDASVAGAQIISSFVLNKSPDFKDPIWSKIAVQYKKLSNEELDKLGYADISKSGFHFISAIVEMKKYLPYLMEKLEKQHNVNFVKQRIEQLNQICEQSSFDYVINCTEIGAKQLFNDNNLFSIKGHLLMAEAPWLKHGVTYTDHPEGCTYFLPLANHILLGGTAEKNVSSKELDEEECQRIFQRCVNLLPSLEKAKIIHKYVGTWSGRKGGVRIELEKVKVNGKECKVVHNYGHGGAGITISYGCASEVCEIICNDMKC